MIWQLAGTRCFSYDRAMRRTEELVHEAYYVHNWNCARTALLALGDAFGVSIGAQLWNAAVGMHGAGGHRDQCGLVEGPLLFFGLYYSKKGWDEKRIVTLCNQYAEAFVREFGSLRCRELRPGGFTDHDPPHLCENLTVRAINFAKTFIEKQTP